MEFTIAFFSGTHCAHVWNFQSSRCSDLLVVTMWLQYGYNVVTQKIIAWIFPDWFIGLTTQFVNSLSLQLSGFEHLKGYGLSELKSFNINAEPLFQMVCWCLLLLLFGWFFCSHIVLSTDVKCLACSVFCFIPNITCSSKKKQLLWHLSCACPCPKTTAG